MRAWTSSEGFVVELGPSAEALVGPLAAELPEGPWRERLDYVRLDPHGRLFARCPLRVWSIEDELGMSLSAVVDGALRHLQVRLFTGEVFRIEKETAEIVDDLQDVALQEVPLLPFVQQEARRIAALDFGLGPDFRRAQRKLASTARNDLDLELAHALEIFGDLARQRDKVRPALEAFLRACALAAGEEVVDVPSAPPPTAPPPVVQVLARRLSSLERRCGPGRTAVELARARELLA